jgi:hypothetical protein
MPIEHKNLTKPIADIVRLYHYAHERWSQADYDSLAGAKFLNGDQWSLEEKAYLAQDDRAPIVYNVILPRILNLIGTEQLNRRSIKVIPYSQEHIDTAQVLNGIVWNNWQTKEFEHYIQKAFGDALICKKGGWIKIYVDYDAEMQPVYSLRIPDPLSVYPDPDYKDYKMTDCRWIFEERWLTLQEIKDVYGDNPEFDIDNDKSWIHRIVDGVRGLFKPDDLDDFIDKDAEKYKVIEFQERRTRRAQLLMNVNTMEKVLVLPDEAKKLIETGEYVFIAETRSKYIHIQTVIPYFDVMALDEPHVLNTDMYDLINVYSIDFNISKSHSSSLVSNLIDPQRNLNKREIQKTSMLDHSTNSPLFFSYEDKETRDEYEKKGNKPGLGFLFRGREKPYRIAPSQLPTGAWQDIQDTVNKIDDISSVNNAMRGQSDYSNESNLLMQTKLSRVAASINPFYNNLSMSRKMVAEYMLKTIKQVFGQTDRTVNTTDRTGTNEQVTINQTSIFSDGIANSIHNFEGSVILDEAEYSPTKRSESFQTKLALVQIIGMQMINPEWLLKDSDLPDIQEQIDYMNQMLGIQAEQSAQQQALQEHSTMLEQLQAEKELKSPTESRKG